MSDKPSTIWTIGHGRASAQALVSFLESAQIRTLVDVRSVPYSRHAPHTARERLGPLLHEMGIEYVFMGDRLAGRPADPRLQKESGAPDYEKMANSSSFREGQNGPGAHGALLNQADLMSCGRPALHRCDNQNAELNSLTVDAGFWSSLFHPLFIPSGLSSFVAWSGRSGNRPKAGG